MRKVLHFVSRMDRAGQETFLMNMYRGINRDSVQFGFLCSKDGKGDYDEEILLLGGNIYHCELNQKSGKLRHLDNFNRLVAEFEKYKDDYDIVHIHNYHAFDILLITCAVYTYSLLHGFKGISKLANICIYMFFGLIAFVLLFGGETRYIIETGFSSLGRMIQNFVDLSTFTDPLRTSNFPQNWTIYYWAYWMVWCVAAPFFIGSISRGRTVRQTILGGYIFGVGSTLTSFIVLGNYSMGMQVTGKADFIAQYLENGDLYGMIVSIIKAMPGAPVIMVVVLLTMIAFYATSFDSIALTASCYSYHTLEDGEQPNKGIQLMWCILLILLPIALLFAESSMNNLQSVSIVAAFPIGAVIVMITVSFMKDAKKYMEELGSKK